MGEQRHLILRISAVICIFLGAIRLLGCLYIFLTDNPLLGDSGLLDAYFALVAASSAWQLFAGFLGWMYWEEPEKADVIAKAAMLALFFDSFIYGAAFLTVFLAFVLILWALPAALILVGFPIVIIYVIAASRLATYSRKHKENINKQSEGLNPENRPEIPVVNNTLLAKLKAAPPFKIIVFSMAAPIAGILIVFSTMVVITIVAVMRPSLPLVDGIPWGTWESENPNIILHLNPEYIMPGSSDYIHSYPAIYRGDDGDTKIFVTFSYRLSMIGRYRPQTISIHGRSSPRSSSENVIQIRGASFRVVEGRLHIGAREDLIFNPIQGYTLEGLNEWIRLYPRR